MHMHRHVHKPGRRRRWLKRGLLGSLALLIVAVAAALAALHTPWGREILRAQVEHQLQHTFTGGASLGLVEGSPLGELTLHDLVINGPDGRPAISVKTLKLRLAILALLSHQARVGGVIAEDVDVDLRRDATGQLEIKHLLRPGPSSAWNVELPSVQLRRAHVRLDAGAEVMNFDALALDARAMLPHGGPIDASLELRGTWRERSAAALDVRTVVHSGLGGLAVPFLAVRAGDVSVTGNHLTIAPREGRMPALGGALVIDASAAAVARLAPSVRMPDDVAISLTATPVAGQPWTELAVAGRLGATPLWLAGTADLDARHARGELTTGTIDLTKLSSSKLVGRAAATVAFDVRPGGPQALPIATATIRGWGEVAGIPRTSFEVTLGSAGERVRAVVDATGDGVKLALAGTVHIVGDVLAIEDTTLRAQVADPARVSGGKAPVHGTLRVDLAAHGALRPAPSLAVTGTVDGRHLRVADLSVASLHVAIDADRLPNRPLGRAHVELVDLVRQNMQLGALTVDAADRTDGKVAVSVRSRPNQGPWLVDADALVTPPAGAGPASVVIELQRHRVRAGNGMDWTGHGGHVEIGPERIAVRDLSSASALGHLAIAARYERAGRHQGDLVAHVDARGLALDSLSAGYHGQLDTRVDVTRRGGAWEGEVQIDGTGLSVEPSPAKLETHVHAELHGTLLAVTVQGDSAGLGSATLALALDTPRVITDARAWQRLGRDAIRTGRLTVRGVQIRRAAELAGLTGAYAGRIDGDFTLSATEAGGRLELHDAAAPQLRGLEGLTAVLDLTQTSPTELAPSLTARVEGIGQLSAQAQLVVPARLFDRAAWTALGRGALRGASVRLADVAVDPAMLDRFGVTSDLRGQVSVAVEVGEAARTVQASVDVAALRGGPIVLPIDVHVDAAVGDRETTTILSVRTTGAPLLEARGRLPGSLAALVQQLRQRGTDPAAANAIPLAATVQLPSVDAPRLLAVFGRTEVIGGRIDGAIELGGTVGAPSVKANFVAIGIRVPPGRGGKPIRTIERLAITGDWDGDAIKLEVDGKESAGGALALALTARPSALRDGRLTLKATKLDLVPILAFLPGPAGGAAGELNADLRVTGLDPRTMQITGELHLTDARLPIAPSVGTLRRAKIDAVIADHQITLGVDGKLGAGTLAVTGTVALDGAAPNGGKAKITLRKVSPIGIIQPQISADISATLSRDGNQWRADLVVDNGNVVVSTDRGEPLKPTGAPTDMTFANGAPLTTGNRPLERKVPVNPIFLVNVTLHSTHVESEEFRGLLKGKLEIRADGNAIGMVGGIDADSGDLDLFGRRYYVERAGVHFDGSLDPLLDIRITHDFSDVTTVTEVHGRVSQPELTMSSDPGTYSQGQLLGFLLGGDPGGDPQSGAASDKVADAGASFLANQLGGYVRKALPISIDVLRYESATATSGAAVTVGTWLTRTLFLAYRQHLESRPDENSGEGSIEYWLSRRIVVEGTAGDRGYNGLDLLWRKRY